MRILHTSDWHLGGQLHEQSRIPEQAKFLEWLKELMAAERPDALIVAGDVFDTCAPSNTALNLYYDFLSAVFKDDLCRRVVVIGGNHDSPSLLDAPGNVLNHLKTRVVGAVSYRQKEDGGYVPDYANEVVVVEGRDGKPGLVIGAVPYLRDSDLRTSAAQEDEADRTEKLRRGFQEHYLAVAQLARQHTATDGSPLPLVLAGHLSLVGGTSAEEKSERDLLIGYLGSLGQELLPPADYYALGHLHCPQMVGGNPACRYSGAPIPMNFGEAGQPKSVVVVDFSPGAAPAISLKTIPQTQRLVQLKGTPEAIDQRLQELALAGESAWVDLQVTEGEGDLSAWMYTVFPGRVEGTALRLLRRQNLRPGKGAPALEAALLADGGDGLKQFNPEQLFAMRLEEEDLTDDEKREFTAMFKTAWRRACEADVNKE